MFVRTLTFAAFVCAPFQAFAADYRVPFEPPVLQPPMIEPLPEPKTGFNWGRCFVGAQVGHKNGRLDMAIPTTDYLNMEYVNKPNAYIAGPFAGLQGGCNVVSGSWLYGFELEGVVGPKLAQECKTRIDPLAYCVDYLKDWQAFATGRVGMVFDGFNASGGAILAYARFGVGYTRTRIDANFNQVSYTTISSQNGGGEPFVPKWANNFDMEATKEFYSPVLGFGLEYALNSDWTVRGEFLAMYSSYAPVNLKVKKVNFTGGDIDAGDPTNVKRHINASDVLAVRLREVETKLTFAVNRLF